MTTCKEPSVYRPLRENRLQVRFADCPDNHAWIKVVCGPRTRLEWNPHHRVWLIARPRLHAIVRGLLERFELPVHVFAEFRTTQQCDHTCQNAAYQECTCPCLGARHGTAHHNGSCPQWAQVGTATSIHHGDGIRRHLLAHSGSHSGHLPHHAMSPVTELTYDIPGQILSARRRADHGETVHTDVATARALAQVQSLSA